MLKFNQPKNILSYIIKKNNHKKEKIVETVSYEEHIAKADKDINNQYNEIELTEDFKFQLAPRPLDEKERMTLFVAGESGAGKSYFIKTYAEYYNKMFKKNPIYLISYLDKDDTLDSCKIITRIKAFTEEFLDDCNKIDLEENFKDSFMIFDDIDSITNKKVKKVIYDFLYKLLRIGRHYNITVAYLGHELYASHDLKAILNESMYITYFPKFLNSKKSNYLLKEYFGLSKLQIERIHDIKDSRFITYCKGADKVIISEHKMFLL